jgi:hypothetical protein
MMNNTEKLSSIAIKLEQVERSLKDIEDLLKSTTSPAEETISEYNMLKDVQSFYTKQYENAMKEFRNA